MSAHIYPQQNYKNFPQRYLTQILLEHEKLSRKNLVPFSLSPLSPVCNKVPARPLLEDRSALPHKQHSAYQSGSAGAFHLHFINNHPVPLLVVGSCATVLQKDRRKGSISLAIIVTIAVRHILWCCELGGRCSA